MRDCGKEFPLTNDAKILKINSPRNRVTGGPYIVVYRNIKERWVIVALDWDKKPSLAIRWFWDKSGNPVSTSHATWFCLPQELHDVILNGLKMALPIQEMVKQYLCGKISGQKLKEQYSQLK